MRCWVHWLLIGMAFLGQGCGGGMHPDRSTEPTGTPAEGLSSAGRARPSPNTPARSESPTSAFANNVELTGPPPVSFESEAQRHTSKSKAQRRTSGSHTGSSYFISPRSTTGTGTKADPFGVAQLLNTTTTPVSQGPALTILQPGDTLYFLGGTYTVSGSTPPNNWLTQLISPTVSGTASEPITLAAYPGATVNFVMTAGNQPLFGTTTPTLNYVRFLGFTIQPLSTNEAGSGVADAFCISGTGNEVAYNTIIGQNHPNFTDNYQGIWLTGADSTWIHNNVIYGFTSSSGDNSSGIKLYGSTYTTIDDNYIYDNSVGISDKDGGNDVTNPLNSINTYTRNWIVDNNIADFLGNNQAGPATYYIYDNVIGSIALHTKVVNSKIYNNLILGGRMGDGVLYAIADGYPSGGYSYLDNIWNNIVITDGTKVQGYYNPYDAFTIGQSTSPLAYMDYNLYDAPSIYEFNNYVGTNEVYTLSQMQAQGFEQHSYDISGDTNIFQNLTTYALLPQWTTAGRYGDTLGPRYSVAQIMNPNRYGPGALSTGSAPVITQEPQNQTVSVGSTATFSIQVTGSGLLYQWQRSNDGGNTWIPLQGANSASYTTAPTSSSDNRPLFRALVSCVGGSAWSDTASLGVRTQGQRTPIANANRSE